MFDFFDFSNMHFYFALIIAFVNAFVMCFEGYKFSQIYQLSGYHSRGYFEWFRTSGGGYIGRLVLVGVLSLLCIAVSGVIFKDYSDYYSYFGLVFYFLFSIVCIKNVYSIPNKTPLKMTNRMNRAIILLWVFSFILTFGFLILTENFVSIVRLGGLAFTPLFLPILVPFVHFLMRPIEKAITKGYLKKAKNKLTQYPDLIKIGITGSFGKTSTKNFLATILAEKYSVCATPFNFNTPLGITRTVLQYLDYGSQVLIAEMGARQVGDIKELCELVEPQYGIVTAIGEQHLATFQTLENIKRTKAELPNYLGENGICVFDMDNENVREIAEKATCKKITVSLTSKDCDIYATEIDTTTTGTNFVLHIGKNKYNCSTKLLGLHNISNLLLCVGLSKQLDLTNEQILTGISKVMPVEHRLQLINAKNNVTILDDSYNSSVDGSKRALDVLAMFEGRRKIVVTPGIVELGTIERLENYMFGSRISQVADIVVIVNKSHYASIKKGLLDCGFNESKIYQAENLLNSQTILKDILQKGDVILWENDLPDNYV